MERRFSSSGWLATVPAGRSGAQMGTSSKRSAEPFERRVARAAEAIDGLVVVTDDDHVVGLVRAAADQLEQQDLGHVGVLELVHEDVPELVLVAANDVRPLGEQLDGQQLLLAEVEQAALAQRALVDAVCLRLFDEPQDVERLGVAHVGRREALDEALLLLRELLVPDGFAGSADIAAGLAVGDLACRVRTANGQLATDHLNLPQVAQRLSFTQPGNGFVEGSGALLYLERLAARVCIGEVLIRRDELVLGPADDVRETSGGVGIARHGVVDEMAELRPQLAQQQALADLVEHFRTFGQSQLRPVIGQDTVAERVEVVHPQPAGDLKPERLLEPLHQLRGRPHVVRQDQHVLRLEVGLSGKQVPHAFHDHGRLAGAGAGQDHQRARRPTRRRSAVPASAEIDPRRRPSRIPLLPSPQG